MPGDGFEHLWAISTSPQGAEEVLKRVIVLRQGESGALECVPMRSVPTSLTIRKRAALVRRWYGPDGGADFVHWTQRASCMHVRIRQEAL